MNTTIIRIIVSAMALTRSFTGIVLWTLSIAACASKAGQNQVRLFWGHTSAAKTAFHVELRADGVTIVSTQAAGLEAGDRVRDGVVETLAGGGDVDGVVCVLRYEDTPIKEIANLNNIWREVIRQADPDTARRLTNDPAYRRDGRRLTVWLDRQGTRGFSVTIDQLQQNRAIWVPSLDVYLSVGERPVPFAEHQAELKEASGRRVLDRVGAEEEATLAAYLACWEDMGSPAYKHPSQPEPGHIVCVGWDSTIPKFGIDRGAGVRSDLGNPDKFQFGFEFGRIDDELIKTWRGQKLTDGLPVIVTTIQRQNVRYEVEQFAYPLHGPPSERRGDIAMMLMQRVRVTNLADAPMEAAFTMQHRRQMSGKELLKLAASGAGTWVCEDGAGDKH